MSTLLASTAPQGMVARHTAFGVPRPLITTTTLQLITRAIPRGGQQRYDYTDYDDAYKNPTSRGDDRYGSTNPDYYEDYHQGPTGDEDRGYFNEDKGYYDDRGTSSMVRYMGIIDRGMTQFWSMCVSFFFNTLHQMLECV